MSEKKNKIRRTAEAIAFLAVCPIATRTYAGQTLHDNIPCIFLHRSFSCCKQIQRACCDQQ